MRSRVPVRAVRIGSWATCIPMLAALGLPGCAFVGPSAIEAKVDSLDHDGDGAPYGGPDKDCNDFNEHETPGKAEIPYDGWDNDCGGDGDLIDIDGDGYPGVTREWYVQNNPEAVWPAGMPDVLDCVDDPAVHPRARDIYPGAADIPYDGIDSDCGADGDFDADRDGFLPDTFVLDGQVFATVTAHEAYVAEWGYDHFPPPVYGDCNDFDANVNPGVPAEQDVWYDGVDSDCAGNNDFDQDGDGYMPDESVHAAAYGAYVQFLGGEAPWGDAMWGDCLDEVRAVFAVDPAAVHPGAADAWYDGIDSDCAGDNDFDQDGDGVMPDTFTLDPTDPAAEQLPTVDAFADYVADWGYDDGRFSPVFGDCDDADPTIHPGALERFGDGRDADCDGGTDTTPWGFANYRWTRPLRPKVVGTDTHYMVLAAAEAADFAVSIDVGIALTFPRPDEALGIPGVGYEPAPAQRLAWLGGLSPQPLGHVLDAVSTGPDVFAAVNYILSSTGWAYVDQRLLEHNPLTDTFSLKSFEYAGTNVSYGATGIDVIVDDDGVGWSTGCDVDTLHAMKGAGIQSAAFATALRSLPAGCYHDPAVDCIVEGPPGGVCFFDGPPDLESNTALIHLCEPEVDCVTYLFAPAAQSLTVAVEQRFAGLSVTEGDHRDGWHLLTLPDAGAMLVEARGDAMYGVLGDYRLRSFDAVRRDADTWFMVALIDVDTADEEGDIIGVRPEILLAWGDPSVDTDGDGDADLHTMIYPFVDPTRPDLVPVGVAVHADGDRLALAVSAHDPFASERDGVGWAFLAWPEAD